MNEELKSIDNIFGLDDSSEFSQEPVNINEKSKKDIVEIPIHKLIDYQKMLY